MPTATLGNTATYTRSYLPLKSKHHITVVGSATIQPIKGDMAGNPQSISLTDEDYLYEKKGIAAFEIDAVGADAEYTIESE